MEHFTKLSYKEGGVTRDQLVALYTLSEKQIADEKMIEFRFYASLQGFDLDKELDKKDSSREEKKLTKEELFREAAESPVPIFRDPSYYDHLTQNEKEQLTQIMMGKHRFWRDKQKQSTLVKGV